jgi:hypothetical protein
MESLLIFWRLLALGSMFVFPQLLGVLLYFRLVRRSRRLAFALGFLVPAVLFFFLAPLFFFAGFPEAESNRQGGCGMASMAAALIVVAGTAAELIVSVPVQLYLFRRNRGSR